VAIQGYYQRSVKKGAAAVVKSVRILLGLYKALFSNQRARNVDVTFRNTPDGAYQLEHLFQFQLDLVSAVPNERLWRIQGLERINIS
jgi:hypothetical protein